MSGIGVKATVARATLYCDKCNRRWESRTVQHAHPHDRAGGGLSHG